MRKGGVYEILGFDNWPVDSKQLVSKPISEDKTRMPWAEIQRRDELEGRLPGHREKRPVNKGRGRT